MKTKTVKQEVTFNAKPVEVYDALMDSAKHAGFTGASASISKKVGGKISAYDDYIEGRNIALAEGKKIAQKWRAANWPEGHYSTATFEFRAENGKTKMIFTQTDVPEGQHEEISNGWKEHYWEKMKDYFKATDKKIKSGTGKTNKNKK